MTDGYSAEQIRATEAPHLAAGVPLMARAAAGLAREIRGLLDASAGAGDLVRAGRILLLVGSGDNGADTLYAGAELAAEGHDVGILTTGTRVREQALAAAVAAGAHRENDGAVSSLAAGLAAPLAAAADVIVDGILGTGTSANPALRGAAADIVAAVLPVVGRSAAPTRPRVVAVDIPSGIDPNTGAAPGPVLPADLTVTFGGHKAGLLLEPGRGLAGHVVLIDIGLGPDLERLEPLVRVE